MLKNRLKTFSGTTVIIIFSIYMKQQTTLSALTNSWKALYCIKNILSTKFLNNIILFPEFNSNYKKHFANYLTTNLSFFLCFSFGFKKFFILPKVKSHTTIKNVLPTCFCNLIIFCNTNLFMETGKTNTNSPPSAASPPPSSASPCLSWHKKSLQTANEAA